MQADDIVTLSLCRAEVKERCKKPEKKSTGVNVQRHAQKSERSIEEELIASLAKGNQST